MGKKKQHKPTLRPGTQKAYRRWAVDHDYVHLLSPEEKAWLGAFDNAYYEGQFKNSPEEWPPEVRKAIHRGQRSARLDAYTAAECAGALDFADSEDEGALDPVPTPEYLNSEEYKRARASFRDVLRPGLRPSIPETTVAFRRRKNRLARIVEAAHSPTPDTEEEEKQ